MRGIGRGAALLALLLAGCDDGSSAGTNTDAGDRLDGGGPGCVNTCEAAGEVECRTPGTRTCADQNGDGCLEWSEVTPCMAGWSCVSGQCVDCINDCQPGSVQCGPTGGTQTCIANGDGDPCFEWGPEDACPAGQSCSANQCRPDDQCVDECGEGDQRCNGNAAQTCERAPNGCTRWGAAAACPAGQTCSLGSCREGECADECEAESGRCRPGGLETCGNFDEDECLEWSTVVACPEGEVCSQGRCTANCANECGPMGARQCSGNGVQVCGRPEGSECLAWGPAMPCAAGQQCSDGNCRAACVNECQDGSTQCAGNGVQRCGNFDDDNCFEWGEPVACDMGLNCSNGECRAQCENECPVINARQCMGNGVQTCGNNDEDPCLEWSVPNDCPGGQACNNGRCGGQCRDECPAGGTQCSGNGVQTCGNFDGDNCREWSGVTACAGGQVCSNGACGDQCDNECVAGGSRCAPNGRQECGNFDGDACTDWGRAIPCAAGEVCSNGECTAECADECQRGGQRCNGNGFEICGDFDADDCAEWSATTPCPDGQQCSNGQCGQGCVDECGEGGAQCSGNGFQNCGNFDGDACLEFGAVVPCPADTVCSEGECSAFCFNECDQGATRCGGGGVQRCGNFDGDNCFEWGGGVACPEGQDCSNGRCQAVCEDECRVGQTECTGNGVRLCGEFDQDACTDWSPGAPCAEGEICADGQCQLLMAGCEADGDCPEGLICLFGACNAPVACGGNEDCFPGENCDLNGVCRPAAPAGIGAACVDDGDCPNELLCLDTGAGGYCTTICNDAPCPSGSTCYIVDEEIDLQVCLADCADEAGCFEGQACYPTGVALGGACFPAQCQDDGDCAGDPFVALSCERGLCVGEDECDAEAGEGCADGAVCVQSSGVGVCLEQCTVIGGDQCEADQQCASTGVGNEGLCIPAGATAAGGPCADVTECQAGLWCTDDGLGNGRCLAICDTGNPDCGGAAQCLSLGGRAGVCVDDCENECNPGDARCAGAAIEFCDQADEDICTEWSAGIACAAGETCDEVTLECVPACQDDADCESPLVAAACEMGQCVLVSQCNPGTGEGCDGADQCFAANEDGSVGSCLEVCNPFGEPCSDIDDGCALFGGGAFCVPAGDVPNGEACESSAECGSGFCVVVDEQGNAACFSICDARDGVGCADNEQCVDLEVDGVLGACVEDCIDECIEGSQLCGPMGGVQTCGVFAGACTSFGPEEPCADGEVCDPDANTCVALGGGCMVDEDCDGGDNVPRVCGENNQCALVECQTGGNACGGGAICAPQEFDAEGNPSAEGFCLNTCEPLANGLCGVAGACGDYPLDNESVEFVCLPDGGLQIIDICEGVVGCTDGLSCVTAFEDADGNPIAACLERCDANIGDADCSGMGDECLVPGYFPEGVGVCVPDL